MGRPHLLGRRARIQQIGKALLLLEDAMTDEEWQKYKDAMLSICELIESHVQTTDN